MLFIPGEEAEDLAAEYAVVLSVPRRVLLHVLQPLLQPAEHTGTCGQKDMHSTRFDPSPLAG